MMTLGIRLVAITLLLPVLLIGLAPAQDNQDNQPDPSAETPDAGDAIDRLIAQLASPDAIARQRAEYHLRRIGSRLIPRLEEALRTTADPEQRFRLQAILIDLNDDLARLARLVRDDSERMQTYALESLRSRLLAIPVMNNRNPWGGMMNGTRRLSSFRIAPLPKLEASPRDVLRVLNRVIPLIIDPAIWLDPRLDVGTIALSEGDWRSLESVFSRIEPEVPMRPVGMDVDGQPVLFVLPWWPGAPTYESIVDPPAELLSTIARGITASTGDYPYPAPTPESDEENAEGRGNGQPSTSRRVEPMSEEAAEPLAREIRAESWTSLGRLFARKAETLAMLQGSLDRADPDDIPAIERAILFADLTGARLFPEITPDRVDRLTGMLRTASWPVRQQAVRILATWWPEVGRGADRDAAIALRAAVLRHLLPTLPGILRSPDPIARFLGAWWVGELRSVWRLIATARSSAGDESDAADSVPAPIAAAIAEMPDSLAPAAIEAQLIEMIQSDEPTVAHQAVQALGRLGWYSAEGVDAVLRRVVISDQGPGILGEWRNQPLTIRVGARFFLRDANAELVAPRVAGLYSQALDINTRQYLASIVLDTVAFAAPRGLLQALRTEMDPDAAMYLAMSVSGDFLDARNREEVTPPDDVLAELGTAREWLRDGSPVVRHSAMTILARSRRVQDRQAARDAEAYWAGQTAELRATISDIADAADRATTVRPLPGPTGSTHPAAEMMRAIQAAAVAVNDQREPAVRRETVRAGLAEGLIHTGSGPLGLIAGAVLQSTGHPSRRATLERVQTEAELARIDMQILRIRLGDLGLQDLMSRMLDPTTPEPVARYIAYNLGWSHNPDLIRDMGDVLRDGNRWQRDLALTAFQAWMERGAEQQNSQLMYSADQVLLNAVNGMSDREAQSRAYEIRRVAYDRLNRRNALDARPSPSVTPETPATLLLAAISDDTGDDAQNR